MNITILTYDTIDSTNTEALEQARQGADEGLCIVAKQQTAGRGRHGRTWASEKNAGLYFSIVLRPKIEAKYLSLITLMAAVAVHDTLAEFGIRPDIKWVNDVLVNEKKICGILAETTEAPNGPAVVVGIGINLKCSNFPPEIADTATSIEDHAVVPSFPIETLTKYLSFHYGVLQSENGPAIIIDEWRKRSTYFFGKEVTVDLGNETIEGITDGLELDGSLRVKKADDEILVVRAGDVTRLRSAKSADANVP